MPLQQHGNSSSGSGGMENFSSSSSSSSLPLSIGFQTFLRQLSTHQNFKLFCLLNLLQVFDCTFEKIFFGSFLRQFSGDDLSTESQSVVVSMSFVLPWGCTVFLTPVVQKLGLHLTLLRLLLRLSFFSTYRIFCVSRSAFYPVLVTRSTQSPYTFCNSLPIQ